MAHAQKSALTFDWVDESMYFGGVWPFSQLLASKVCPSASSMMYYCWKGPVAHLCRHY